MRISHLSLSTHFKAINFQEMCGRLMVFLFEEYLVRNQPESVLKMFLKLVSEILQIIYY